MAKNVPWTWRKFIFFHRNVLAATKKNQNAFFFFLFPVSARVYFHDSVANGDKKKSTFVLSCWTPRVLWRLNLPMIPWGSPARIDRQETRWAPRRRMTAWQITSVDFCLQTIKSIETKCPTAKWDTCPNL